MGAVSIWSMHFIGNNSMTLILHDDSYQLSYKAGYTFASLVVAIACMFLAFAFVGITEDAKLMRIIPSGIFAGVNTSNACYPKLPVLNCLFYLSLSSWALSACIIWVKYSVLQCARNKHLTEFT